MIERKRDLLEAARAVRPYLAGLVDQPEALDSDLLGLLVRGQTGEEVEEQVAAVFAREDRLIDWVATFVQYGVPPDVVVEVVRGIEPLPGRGEPIEADRFACPVDGNFAFYRRRVGQPIPSCPDHGVTLVAAP